MPLPALLLLLLPGGGLGRGRIPMR
eukprot:COSAG01_NODE_44826_length_415_cov_0.816456_1_plen_24_part_10